MAEPARGTIVVNPGSGADDGGIEAVAAQFPDHDVIEREGDGIKQALEEAAAGETSFIGAAGGDGTIRCAAAVAAAADVALLCIPGGTLNHFARELGVGSLGDAAAALRLGNTRAVDLAELNGECFVNNSSIGLYAKAVAHRDRHLRHWPRLLANLVAVARQIRRGHRFWVGLEGTWYRAWMVFVGNGAYGRNLLELGTRESLADGLLDVRIARADARLARARIAFALLLGRLDRSPLLVRWSGPDVELELRTPRCEVALDGEVQQFDAPLRYRCRAGALTVLAPPEG